MNIGQLMGSLLGEVQALDSKALELKVGQIVRGVFVQMIDNQEALVQINGTQVRAKLETPLQPGQSTLLQVQPQSTAGTLVLKPVDGQSAVLPEESLKDLAKALGLPDQKWALELARDLRRDGLTAVTRETARQFQQAAALMPQGEDPQTWMGAASLAHKRGLPMTGATIGALQQALYGAPAHALLETLEQGLAAWRGSSAGAAAAAASASAAAAGAAAANTGAAAQGAAAKGAANPSTAQAAAAAPSSPNVPAQNQAGTTASAGATQSAQQSSPSGWLDQLIKWLGVDHERMLAAPGTNPALQAGSAPEGRPDGTVLPQGADKQAAAARPGDQQQTGALQQDRGAVPVHGDRIGQLAQAGTPAQMIVPDAAQQEAAKPPSIDSLKSVLMTLASGDDVPPALRETAQQLVQQITGQQLLLSQERTGSPFTHITMFIPLRGSDGSQTASVHIQTRRGRKGELDAHNCRLLFDLRMKSLGDTVVDVQIVDRIVSLNLWNDHPAIAELLESSRGEVTEALQNAGYQLLTLRSTPMPDRTADASGAVETKSSSLQTPAAAEWSSKPYKGVDFRA
ncbi:hypothetical protein PAECIP111893_01031 [Paenibacillus plantiphilus]|uniref:Hook-length control protein FliK n=1 Tax=Paenibacillus plantiphilus TaxID=2905650 RepID=A0ABM9BZ83_9BACL|nr:flagellar hook-length control protein FliK [Paenibacillus plantiphilus]CAH1197871.1 hypothetical protein PAECIP111893_01031 [Paenibacillus plantiphilus]